LYCWWRLAIVLFLLVLRHNEHRLEQEAEQVMLDFIDHY